MNRLLKIDVASIIDELDLETKARDQARKHMPNKDSTKPDFVEHQIIDYINDLKNRGRSEAEAVVMGLQKRFAEIDLESYEREIRDLPDYIHLQVDRELTNHREELIELRRNERIRLAELSAFEDEHKLVDGAEYPESQIYHWAIVGAMVLTESIANSYFFAKGSDLGLVGGILQAMLISIVNIGAGLHVFSLSVFVSTLRRRQALYSTRNSVMSSGATSIYDSLRTLSEYRKQAHLRGQKDVLTSMARFDFGLRACISLITARIRPKTASNPVHPLKFASEASRREHFLRESYAVMFFALRKAFNFFIRKSSP